METHAEATDRARPPLVHAPLRAYGGGNGMLAQRGSGGGGVRGGARGSARGGSSVIAGGEHQTSDVLATDSLPVVKESRAYAAHFDIVHLPQQEVGRHDPKMGQALLWTSECGSATWGQTDWTQHMAWTATVEMLLLAHADLFIGKFTSNIFRAAYALRAAQCDCAPPFASLDAPMCFDYGVRSGRNWEFSLVNVSLGARDRADATFQC